MFNSDMLEFTFLYCLLMKETGGTAGIAASLAGERGNYSHKNACYVSQECTQMASSVTVNT